MFAVPNIFNRRAEARLRARTDGHVTVVVDQKALDGGVVEFRSLVHNDLVGKRIARSDPLPQESQPRGSAWLVEFNDGRQYQRENYPTSLEPRPAEVHGGSVTSSISSLVKSRYALPRARRSDWN